MSLELFPTGNAAGPAVASPARRRRGTPPSWERGYRAHFYRTVRGDKLGQVMLSERGVDPVQYRWEAGTLSGIEGSLGQARACVEAAVGFGMRQLTLF
jgi:hypothetical protein